MRPETRFVAVAAEADVRPGTVTAVEAEGLRLALVHDGRVLHAVGGDCTHAGGPLGEGSLDGACLLTCPWHGAVFDAGSGAVMRGPARKPLRTYQVKVADGHVWVAVPSTERIEVA